MKSKGVKKMGIKNLTEAEEKDRILKYIFGVESEGEE